MLFVFFFNDTATTEIYTLSLHDALPISSCPCDVPAEPFDSSVRIGISRPSTTVMSVTSTPNSEVPLTRSEEHTSELQSQSNLVCRLLLEKKKKNNIFLQSDHTSSECALL